MSEPEFKAVKLVGRHVPDSSTETDANGHKYQVPLPGHFEFGFMFGKRFQPVGSFKAGNVLTPDGKPVEPESKSDTADTSE